MFVPTKASLSKNKLADSYETIVFETRKQTKSASNKPNLAEKTLSFGKKEAGNVDLKKLRYEVIKFGSSGFESWKMKQSRIALAVSLGAKPPKREGKNYKDILEGKKKEKDNLEKMNKLNASNLLFKKRETKLKGKRRKETKGLLKNYGRVKLNAE